MGSGIRQYVVLMTLTPQSLRRRLPLFISTLLIIVVAAVCWLSYREIEHVLVAATNARLTSATQQLADILGESTHRSDADLRRVADNSGIINLLEHPTNEARNEAHAVLEQERRRNADGYGQSVSGGIVDRNGRVVLFHGAAFPIDPLLLAAANTEPPANQPTGQTYSPQLSTHRVRIGRFSRTDSGVAYAASTPIVDKSGNSIGWLVQYRRVPSAQAIAQIGAIIGPSARLLVGNADGSIWTDFRRIVSGPPGESRRQGPWEYATVDGEREIGVVTTVPNTTWSVWVEIPRSGAVAAGKPFLARIAFIGLIFVIVGTMLASIVSKWVTEPLILVSDAARDIANGDYTRRVSVSRNDELGDLATSFNSMAAQVQAASTDLQVHAIQLQSANAELVASQDRILSSERQFRAVIENSSDMMAILNADGLPRYVSPSQERLLGVPVSELANSPAFSRQHPDDIATVKAAFAEVLTRDGASVRLQFRRRHRNGTWRNTSAVMTNLLNNPDVRGVVVNSQDVTEQVQLEAQLLQSQKMEAVGQLAGGIAHDFNNLLTVVTSCSAMLLADLPEDDPSRSDVNEISDAAVRAAALTRQLLAFSRRQMLEPQLLDLNALIGRLQKMLGRLLPDNVPVTTALGEYVAAVYADPGQIEQVIVNLAVNARDAMPDGGTLIIETSEVDLDSSYCNVNADVAPGRYVMLAVSDTGIGIEAATQSRMFDPFFTTREAGKGTGLGLATVYGIVKQSGGHVAVYSERGIGTTFKIYLPRARSSQNTDGSSMPCDAVRRGTEFVLLVEDDAQVRAAARRVLDRAGYEVLEARSGPEAIALCEERKPRIDLVLTDMVMPNMSGRELATAIRARYPHAAVAFMSGYTEDATLRKGGLSDGTVFIHKPFTPEGLTKKLRQALDMVAVTT